MTPPTGRPVGRPRTPQTLPLPHNYSPRGYQQPFWDAMLAGCKRSVLVWHRRAGKDKTAWNWMVFNAVAGRVGTYYYLLPTYAQAKKIIWDGIDRDGFRVLEHVPREVLVSRNETDMQLQVKNARGGNSIIQLIGTDKIDSLRGTNPVGCVFSEYAMQDPTAFQLLEPILLENDGWAVFVYTPLGRNHGYDLYEMARQRGEWFTSLLTIRDTARGDGTPVIAEHQIDDIRAQGTDDETIQQEYYCSFHGSIRGAYYAEQIKYLEANDRIRPIPWEPNLPVATWWDLGVDDSTTVWFAQRYGREVRLIDYLEDSGEGLAYYIKLLRERPYVYTHHVMPHDIAVVELGTGKSRRETATQLGLRPIVTTPRLSVEDGISAVRQLLPRCWFDIKKTERGISALKHYSKDWDDDKQTFKLRPRHDQWSHGADAFRTGAVGDRDHTLTERPTRAETAFDIFTYDQPPAGHRDADTRYDPFVEEPARW